MTLDEFLTPDDIPARVILCSPVPGKNNLWNAVYVSTDIDEFVSRYEFIPKKKFNDALLDFLSNTFEAERKQNPELFEPLADGSIPSFHPVFAVSLPNADLISLAMYNSPVQSFNVPESEINEEFMDQVRNYLVCYGKAYDKSHLFFVHVNPLAYDRYVKYEKTPLREFIFHHRFLVIEDEESEIMYQDTALEHRIQDELAYLTHPSGSKNADELQSQHLNRSASNQKEDFISLLKEYKKRKKQEEDDV